MYISKTLKWVVYITSSLMIVILLSFLIDIETNETSSQTASEPSFSSRLKDNSDQIGSNRIADSVDPKTKKEASLPNTKTPSKLDDARPATGLDIPISDEQPRPTKPNQQPPAKQGSNLTTIGGYSLRLEAEANLPYTRDDYGNHDNHDLCLKAKVDPYTGKAINNCHVDHVVALAEAHQSGASDWPQSKKRRFSRDRDNHLGVEGCLNQSKRGHDLSEWKYAWTVNKTACHGGYLVLEEGRCLITTITLKVKSNWDLSVDSNEAEALEVGLGDCQNGFGSQKSR